MNDQAWTIVAIFLGLTGTVSGFISLVVMGAEKKPKDPDTTKGKSWYEGYDKGVETARKVYEGQPTSLERHAIAQDAYNKGLEAGKQMERGPSFQAGYDKGKIDAQNEKGSYSDGYEKGRSVATDAELETHYKRGFENGNRSGLNQGNQDGYKKGWGEAKLFYEKPNVSPSRSDAYMDGIKTMADAMQAAMPNTPEEVYQQAEKHLQKMGCSLQQFIWVPFTGPYPGGKRP